MYFKALVWTRGTWDVYTQRDHALQCLQETSALYVHECMNLTSSVNLLLSLSVQGSMTSFRRRQSCWCPPGSRSYETIWTPACLRKLPSTSWTTTHPLTPRTLSARTTAVCTRTPSCGTNPGLSEVSVQDTFTDNSSRHYWRDILTLILTTTNLWK